MANDLSKEQLENLNNISNLPIEKQQEALEKFMLSLSSDQKAQLENQIYSECIFCSIVQKKIKSYEVYQDEDFMAVLDINPATLGHILLFPKKHISSFLNLESSVHAIMTKIAHIMKDTLKIPGYNILIAEGKTAGQNVDHCLIHIIPRYPDDGINFNWKSKKLDKSVMEQIHKKLRVQRPSTKKQIQITKKEKKYPEKIRIP